MNKILIIHENESFHFQMKYITKFVRSSDTHDSNFRIVTHYVRLSINKQVNHNSCHLTIAVANSLEPDQA